MAQAAFAAGTSGDVGDLLDLQRQTVAVKAAQAEILALCEATTGTPQFELYRIYNRSMGTWRQIDRLVALLELAIAAPATDDALIRAELRDQIEFARWELDENLAELGAGLAAHVVPEAATAAAGELFILLRDARVTVGRRANTD